MTKWKLPPKAKVFEALSALADGRVRIIGPTSAEVVSSSHDKTYSVVWSKDLSQITSNDNASYWQGYYGYPIIAVLLSLKKIDFNENIAKQLSGVPWKEINSRFKRDYDRAVNHVLEQLDVQGGNRADIIQEVDRIFDQLSHLNLERAQQYKKPPKGI